MHRKALWDARLVSKPRIVNGYIISAGLFAAFQKFKKQQRYPYRAPEHLELV